MHNDEKNIIVCMKLLMKKINNDSSIIFLYTKSFEHR